MNKNIEIFKSWNLQHALVIYFETHSCNIWYTGFIKGNPDISLNLVEQILEQKQKFTKI